MILGFNPYFLGVTTSIIVIFLQENKGYFPYMADQEFRKKFGNRLRILRLVRRLTQEQLAELAGLSVNFVSLVETGQSSPSAETISKLARALGVNEGELFKFDER